jgi:hypothetical protein
MLAGSLRFGAAALINLCVLTIPLSAQSPSPAMSFAERRAAFEQALQLRQAGRHQEGLTALIKAGNAGERRAAALAAIAFEEGLGARAAAETAAQWHLVAATGSLTANVPVQVEWLGDGAIRYHVKPDHQRVTFRADGSWTRELLHERILVKDGADGLAGHDSTQYTIHEDASGTVTVTDWRGGWWSLTAPSPEDRLTRDERAGDLTFRDDLRQTVTIRLNGRRTIASDSGNIRRRELDAGGRLISVYDAAGKAPNQYQHDYRGTAEPVMTRFINPQGALWGMTPLAGDGQRWTLLNSDTPSKPVTMDVGIRLNRANSLVTQDGLVRRIDLGDGARVDERRRQEPGGAWTTEKAVGTRDKPAAVGYALVTHARGAVLKQELKSGAGHFVRGGDGRDHAASSWWVMDKSGQRKPGTAWVGDIYIDDNGTLIKRGYVSEPDPGRPGDIRARRDGRGQRILEAVTYVFTSGESEQHLGHGGVIRRDLEGDVLWTITPGGETTRYYYRGEGEAKVLIGIREGANPRWTWVEHWASRLPSKDNLATASFINTTVNRRSGDAEWEDKDWKTRTTYRVDGSRRHAIGDGATQRVIEVDARGRPTRFLAPATPEFKLYYAADGRLERVDHQHAQGFSIIDLAYQATPALPLNKEVLRGTKLEFLGWGNARYVSFLDARGHRLNFWGGATVEEYDGEANTPLIRLTLRNHFTIVKRGHETPSRSPSDRVTVAEKIERLSGARWDQSVIYSDAQGRRWQRFVSSALSELDAAGRLIRHTDERSRSFEFGYAKDGSLETAATPDRRLRRGSLPGGIVDFQLTKGGHLVLTLASGFEVYKFPDGRRVTIGADGALSTYDHRDRLSEQEDLDGKSTYLFYESDTPGSAARKEVVEGNRPRADGVAATIDIALDQGRLRTVERSVKGRDGKTTRTVVARRDGEEWIDDEQTRYSAAWITQTPRRVFLASDHGTFLRVIREDGGETRVGYDNQYGLRFRVDRNAWGEVTAVKHADRKITRFIRDEAGTIDVVTQSADALVLDKKQTLPTFGPSISPRSRWPISLLVNSQGVQIWSARTGFRRIVSPDGQIELSRPDGSKCFFGPDGTRRHVFARGASTSVSQVTEHQNGDLEWVLADGAVGRHAAHGLIIESFRADRSPALDGQGRPRRSRGHAAVTSRGDLALLTLDPPALVIRHADGRVKEFSSAGSAAWKDPETGEVFAGSWHEVQQRLAAIGAAAPGLSSRHLDLAKTESANRYRLTLGLFELEAPPIQSPRRPVPLVTQARRERSIASVMQNADGTTRIDYAPVPRPQPPPAR